MHTRTQQIHTIDVKCAEHHEVLQGHRQSSVPVPVSSIIRVLECLPGFNCNQGCTAASFSLSTHYCKFQSTLYNINFVHFIACLVDLRVSTIVYATKYATDLAGVSGPPCSQVWEFGDPIQRKWAWHQPQKVYVGYFCVSFILLHNEALMPPLKGFTHEL